VVAVSLISQCPHISFPTSTQIPDQIIKKKLGMTALQTKGFWFAVNYMVKQDFWFGFLTSFSALIFK
jgi:hypothetical protein